MKKILNWVWSGIKYLWAIFPKYLLYIIILAVLGAVIAKWITGDDYYRDKVGAIIGFGLLGCVIGYVWLRQLWWWFTKTGDYAENSDKKE